MLKALGVEQWWLRWSLLIYTDTLGYLSAVAFISGVTHYVMVYISNNISYCFHHIIVSSNNISYCFHHIIVSSNNISYCFHHIIESSNWCYSRTLNLISTFYYSIKQILCTHFLWIYTCSTFPCQRAAVVSCCTLHNPFLDVPLLLRCIYFIVDLCFSKTMISSERCRLLWPYRMIIASLLFVFRYSVFV